MIYVAAIHCILVFYTSNLLRRSNMEPVNTERIEYLNQKLFNDVNKAIIKTTSKRKKYPPKIVQHLLEDLDDTQKELEIIQPVSSNIESVSNEPLSSLSSTTTISECISDCATVVSDFSKNVQLIINSAKNISQSINNLEKFSKESFRNCITNEPDAKRLKNDCS